MLRGILVLKNFWQSSLESAKNPPIPILLGEGRALDNVVLRQEECMHFRPLHDRVVVRRVTAEEKSAGGIIIPDTAQEKPQEGEVISVGPGALDDNGKRIAPEVKPGDRVLFGKWSGTEVKIDGKELLIMKEADIMGILDKPSHVRKAA
jgi:chaperonin GroES